MARMLNNLAGIIGCVACCRKDFEDLAADFFDKAAAPAAALLERSGLDADSLGAVELLGGGSRIPAVKAALSAALGGRSLDK